jgi:hypothetical protein
MFLLPLLVNFAAKVKEYLLLGLSHLALQTIVVCQGDAGPIDSLLINLDICFIL